MITTTTSCCGVWDWLFKWTTPLFLWSNQFFESRNNFFFAYIINRKTMYERIELTRQGSFLEEVGLVDQLIATCPKCSFDMTFIVPPPSIIKHCPKCAQVRCRRRFFFFFHFTYFLIFTRFYITGRITTQNESSSVSSSIAMYWRWKYEKKTQRRDETR